MMKLHITGIAAISPQNTWENSLLSGNPVSHSGNRLTCIEPDYTQFVDVKTIRRMSRIIKMGVAASAMALREGNINMPDAIITGTGFGCLEDTGIFLTKMLDNDESALNPTPFIQSTHNTIGSQIALLMQCQGYNQTFTQSSFSFENALLDAMMLLSEKPGSSILLGGVDEVTDISHHIHRRFNIFRDGTQSNLELFRYEGNGTIHGEGASFFVVGGEGRQYGVSIDAVQTCFKRSAAELEMLLSEFLRSNGMSSGEVSLVLLGASGSREFDNTLNDVTNSVIPKATKGRFKHLCGEYPTASAFAVWLAASMLRMQKVPRIIATHEGPLDKILVINQYFGRYHSFILLTRS